VNVDPNTALLLDALFPNKALRFLPTISANGLTARRLVANLFERSNVQFLTVALAIFLIDRHREPVSRRQRIRQMRSLIPIQLNPIPTITPLHRSPSIRRRANKHIPTVCVNLKHHSPYLALQFAKSTHPQ
jgi:hypothetical protein